MDKKLEYILYSPDGRKKGLKVLQRGKDLCYRYNNIPPSDQEARDALLDELLENFSKCTS